MSIQKGFVLSIIIHVVVLGAVVFGSYLDIKTPDPVIVVEALPGGNGGTGAKDIGFKLKKGEPSCDIKKKTVARHHITEKAISIEKKKAENVEPLIESSEAISMNDTSLAFSGVGGIVTGTSETGGGSGGAGSGGFGGGTGGQEGSGGGTGKGHGTGSGDGNPLVEQYLAKHFAYIRDLIMKHLKYPQIAKKMGWKGKVVVSFLIKENGNVENSKILTSSGYEVLDRNVMETIHEVQPFPKPPVRAELIIPVVYALR